MSGLRLEQAGVVRRRRVVRLAGAVLAVALAGSLASVVFAEGQTSLVDIEARVERDYPRVASMLPQHLDQLIRERRDVVVLDVREADEFAVSHIPGAVHVDPGLTASQFQAQFGPVLAGRTVIVYCSVGVRSSKLAERVASVTRAAGATGVYNLKGGIFAWHNFGLGLAQGEVRTDFVHPYSRSWSRYLDFPNYARYAARD